MISPICIVASLSEVGLCPEEGDFPAPSFSMTRAPPAIRRTCSPDPFRSFLSACSGVYVPFNAGEILPRVSSAL